jgi:hypothetical protein
LAFFLPLFGEAAKKKKLFSRSLSSTTILVSGGVGRDPPPLSAAN